MGGLAERYGLNNTQSGGGLADKYGINKPPSLPMLQGTEYDDGGDDESQQGYWHSLYSTYKFTAKALKRAADITDPLPPQLTEAYAKSRKEGKGVFDASTQALSDYGDFGAESFKSIWKDFGGGVNSLIEKVNDKTVLGTVDSVVADIQNPASGLTKLGSLGIEVAKGVPLLPGMILNDALTTATGFTKDQNGEMISATPKQYGAAMKSTAAAVAAGAVYEMTAGAMAGVLGTELTGGTEALTQNALKLAKLSKSSRYLKAGTTEMMATVASNAAYSAVNRLGDPDYIQNVMGDIIDPKTLLFSGAAAAAFGGLRYKSQTSDIREILEKAGSMTYKTMYRSLDAHALKSMEVSPNMTSEQLMQLLPSLSSADDLLEASAKFRITNNQAILFPELAQEQKDKLLKSFYYAGEEYAPAKNLVDLPDNIQKILDRPVKTKGKPVENVFESNLDKLAYYATIPNPNKAQAARIHEILDYLQNNHNLPKQVVESHGNFVRSGMESIEPSPLGQVKVLNPKNPQGSVIQYQRTVPDTPFNPMFGKEFGPDMPIMYTSNAGPVLITPTPLDTQAKRMFTETGFLPDQLVSHNGRDAIIHDVRAGSAIISEPDIGSLKYSTSLGNVSLHPEFGKVLNTVDGTFTTPASLDAKIINAGLYEKVIQPRLDDLVKNPATLDKIVNDITTVLGIPAENSLNVKRWVNTKLAEEFHNALSPEERRTLVGARKIMQEQYRGEVLNGMDTVWRQAQQKGYYVTRDGGQLVLNGGNGEVLRSADWRDLGSYLSRDSQTLAAPFENNGISRFTGINFVPPKSGIFERAQQAFAPRYLAKPLRRMEFMDGLAGHSGLGAKASYAFSRGISMEEHFTGTVGKKMNQDLNSIMHETDALARTRPDLPREITAIQETASIPELQQKLSPQAQEIGTKLQKLASEAGGIENLQRYIESGMVAMGKEPMPLNPALEQAKKLFFSIEDKNMKWEAIRYAKALDHPEAALSKPDLIAKLGLNPKEVALVERYQKWYQDAFKTLEIDPEKYLQDYVPIMRSSRANIYGDFADKDVPGTFIHELDRTGLTSPDGRELSAPDIAYKYARSGIRVKSGAADLYGEGNKALKDLVKYAAENEKNPSLASSVESFRKDYMKMVRGVPDQDAKMLRNVMANDKAIKFLNNLGLNGLQLINMNLIGGRPWMSVVDLVTSAGMTYFHFGDKILNKAMARFGQASEAAMNELEKKGLAPNTAELAGSMLTREASEAGTLFNRATDFSINTLSLQHAAYKGITRALYSTISEEVASVGSRVTNRMITVEQGLEEMKTLYGSFNPDVQNYFVKMFSDPVNRTRAAEYLGHNAAIKVANKYGRLNNPIGWSSLFGRAFGQMGSWTLNLQQEFGAAMNGTWKEAAPRLARFAVANAGIGAVMYAVGAKPGTYMPITSILPGVGPIFGVGAQVNRYLPDLLSTDENTQNNAINSLVRLSNGLLTPAFIRNAIKAKQIADEEGDYWKALLKASGAPVPPAE